MMKVSCINICCHSTKIAAYIIVFGVFGLLVSLSIKMNPWVFGPILIFYILILIYCLIIHCYNHHQNKSIFNNNSGLISPISISIQTIELVNLQLNQEQQNPVQRNQLTVRSTEPPPSYETIQNELPPYEMFKLPSYEEVVKDSHGTDQSFNGTHHNNNSLQENHFKMHLHACT